MKNSEANKNLNISFGVQGEKKIYCTEKNVAYFVCQNKKCQKKSFVCSKMECLCRESHPKCSILQLASMIRILTPETISLKSIEDAICDKIQKTIDQLSDFRDKLILLLREDLNTFGLKKQKQLLFEAIKSGNVQKVTGRVVWDAINDDDDEQNFQQRLKQLQINISEIWKDFQNQLKPKSIQIIDELQNFKKKLNLGNQLGQQKISTRNQLKIKGSSQSPSIISSEDLKIFALWLNKSNIKLELKFRASQFDFQLSKYYELCGHLANTVIIAKTTKGKIIGGYTPLTFNPQPNGISKQTPSGVLDKSNSSFIFSLSERQKFELIKGNYAINRLKNKNYIDFNNGFWLKDKSNIDINCFYLGSNVYNTTKYRSNKESYLNITGQESEHFFTEQWEVYQVVF